MGLVYPKIKNIEAYEITQLFKPKIGLNKVYKITSPKSLMLDNVIIIGKVTRIEKEYRILQDLESYYSIKATYMIYISILYTNEIDLMSRYIDDNMLRMRIDEYDPDDMSIIFEEMI